MKQIKKHFTIFGIALAALFMSACATDISSNSYSDEHVGEVGRNLVGVVTRVRTVKVAPDQLDKSYAGTVAGGIGGSLIGSQFASGFGNALSTVAGGMAGALGGAKAEQALKTQKGLEITVRTGDGNLLTVVQGDDVKFASGEHVTILFYSHGRSKVVKENG